MSADEQNTEEATEQPGPVAGQRLAVARKNRNLDIATVVAELHIDADKVRALEENRFEQLGASVYTKGYLRRYANLVGVSTDDVFAEYYELTRSDSAPPVVITRTKPPREWSLGPWIVGVVLLAAFGAFAYWWFSGAFDSDQVASNTRSEVPASKTDTVVLPPATMSEPVIAGESEEHSAPNMDTADELLGEPIAEPASTELALTLYFRGDCWTEVTDATGARLYYDLGKTGRAVDLTGSAPVTLLLGDASQVDIEVNGRSFDIPAENIEGSLARLQINKQ